MKLFCRPKNPAQRRYYSGALLAAFSYSVLFLSATSYVRHAHPTGVSLYAVAMLPTFSILCFLYVVGRYLREETDEFVRDQFVRSALWAIAAVMAFEMFVSFLRTFGWDGTVKPFTEYYVFCITLLIAKFSYRLRDRVAGDD